MNILVIGGSGYIGNYISKMLCNKMHLVTIYDINKPLKNTYFKYVNGDVENTELLSNSMKGIDLVIDLAFKNTQNISEYFDINIKGVKNVLECMRQNNIKDFIFLSTNKIYEDCLERYEHTNLNIDDTESSFYVFIENLIKSYEHYNINSLILRTSNVMGNVLSYKKKSNDFLKQLFTILKTNTNTKCDLSQVKSFIHLEDLCDFILNNLSLKGTYNINGYTMTLKEIVTLIERISGETLNIVDTATTSTQKYTISCDLAKQQGLKIKDIDQFLLTYM